jgi:hypothetical protein
MKFAVGHAVHALNGGDIMRRHEPVRAHVKKDTGWREEELEASGAINQHRAVHASNFQSNDRYLRCWPQVNNLVWSYHLTTVLESHGRVVCIFIVFDEHTQECLLSLAADHISTGNVIDELFSLFLQRGIPKYLFAFDDNVTLPNAICEWLRELELSSPLVELKKYGESGYGALFKDKLIKDLFHEKSFDSLAEVQLWLANWRSEHNRSINLLQFLLTVSA